MAVPQAIFLENTSWKLTRWGVWIGDRASKSAMGNSTPFLFSSSYMCTTPVRSGLLLKASAHAWEERGRPVRRYKWSFHTVAHIRHTGKSYSAPVLQSAQGTAAEALDFNDAVECEQTHKTYSACSSLEKWHRNSTKFPAHTRMQAFAPSQGNQLPAPLKEVKTYLNASRLHV